MYSKLIPIFLLALGAISLRASGDEPAMMNVRGQQCELDIRRDNGSFCRITDKSGHVMLSINPNDAGSFRLVMQDGSKNTNIILGKDQLLTSARRTRDGILLRWNGPLKTTDARTLDINVVMRVRLNGERLEFTLNAENKSQLMLKEAHYPILGGFVNPAGGNTKSALAEPLILNYPDGLKHGPPDAPLPADYQGGYPIWMGMAWVDLFSPELNRGLFFADLDPLSRAKFVQVEKSGGGVPVQEGGQPVGTFYWIHHPDSKPNSKFKGPPVVLQFHDGGWLQACQIYRDWFVKQFGIADPAAHWLRQLPAYQDVMFLLPEGNINMRFADIPQWARDGLKCGIKALMISGWQIGGHDGWYPYYTPDPRLGTWDELKAAIQECHKLGVKVFFFVNYCPVDRNTEWFQKELKNYLYIDVNGHSGGGGWGMGTVSARKGWTFRSLDFASAAFPEYRHIITRQMTKLAQIGADGLHFDKFIPLGVNYNPDIPVGADMAETREVMRGIEEVAKACRKINPDFIFSFETCWDRPLQYSAGATWHWPGGMQDCFDMFKFAFPEWINVLPVNQPYDYAVVNNCVMYGYQILVGPKNFTTSIGDKLYAPLGNYIKDVITIIEDQKETILLGRYLVHNGVVFDQVNGANYGVHQSISTSKRAVVIVNPSTEPIEVTLKCFTGSSGTSTALYRPGQRTKHVELPLTISIPGERLAVAAEQ